MKSDYYWIVCLDSDAYFQQLSVMMQWPLHHCIEYITFRLFHHHLGASKAIIVEAEKLVPHRKQNH